MSLKRCVGLLAAGLLSLVAASCVGPREGAAPDGPGSSRIKNGSNVLGSDSFDDFTGALALVTSMLKTDAPKWDVDKELEDNTCTPSDRNGKPYQRNLAGCVYSDPTAGWVDYAAMKGSDRTKAIQTNLRNWYYQLVKWPRNFTKADLKGATFRNIDLSFLQKMTNPQYGGKTVGENARFAGAKFAGATFQNVRVGGSFVGADFREFRVKSLGDLSRARLDGANFSGADLAFMTLPSSLLGANFTGADMREVKVVEGLLTSATFDDANLAGASLAKASIGGRFDLSSELVDLKLGFASKVTSMKRANLSFADLSGANLSRVDLSGANLTGANLSGANLKGTKFNGANLTGANLTGAQFDCAFECSSANAELTTFDGANLASANLTKTSGSNVNFANVSAVGANFSESNYSRADFTNADVSGANFSKSILNGVKFANALGLCTNNGYCTNFSGANLMSSHGSEFKSEFAKFSGGSYLDREPDFSRANFSNANISGVEFFMGKVRQAIFSCARMDGTLFSGQPDTTGAVFEPKLGSAACQVATALPSDYPKPASTTVPTKPVVTPPDTTLPVFVEQSTTTSTTTSTSTTVAPTTTVAKPNRFFVGFGKCPAGYKRNLFYCILN